MDNKQIEEGIKVLQDLADGSPTAEIEITLEDKNALIFAISKLQLFLSVKGMPKKKEGIIAILDKEGNKYYKQEDLANGAYNQAIDEFTAWLVGIVDVENIRDFLEYWGYRQGNLIKLNDDDNLKIATAIKTMIMGGEE